MIKKAKMKIIFIILATVFLIGIQARYSHASIILTDTTLFTPTGTIPSEDYNSHNIIWGPNVRWLSGLPLLPDWVQWTHHFSFDPPKEKVLSGTISLTLFDDDPADNRVWKLERGFGWGEDFSWVLNNEVDPGVYSYSVNATYLEDGTYRVTLASLFGGFGISESDLIITYDPVVPEPVIPEPATLSLLGLGLFAFAVRKKRSWRLGR